MASASSVCNKTMVDHSVIQEYFRGEICDERGRLAHGIAPLCVAMWGIIQPVNPPSEKKAEKPLQVWYSE